MASDSETPSTVLVYNGTNLAPYLSAARQGAQEAGWRSMLFNDGLAAEEEFGAHVGALILAVDKRTLVNALDPDASPLLRLVAISDQLNIPRAVLSPLDLADYLQRKGGRDATFSETLPSAAAKKVTSWLLGLIEAKPPAR